MTAQPAFEVVAPAGAGIPVIAHVPHAATAIPDAVRAELLIDDEELAGELIRLTDWHTDELFAGLAAHGASLFLNRLSRLVFDPERFLDVAREQTESRGQGLIYTLGSLGQPLREASAEQRTETIETLYRPYHAALDAAVGGLLERFGRCTIIDCHSFPSVALPSELDQAPDRPDICIGTDASHTPPALATALVSAFTQEGLRVQLDRPFAGTFVPGGFYERELRVHSVMIEVRRGLYLDERTGERGPGFGSVRAAVERAVASVGLLQV